MDIHLCKAGQTPLLRPRPGISPRHSRMAYGGSIAPGPGGSLQPRPYRLTLPPPIHGPPPGGVYPMAGAYGQDIGGLAYMGRGAYARGAMSQGPICYHVKEPGIVPGAAPMGAGLVWHSRRLSGAIMAGLSGAAPPGGAGPLFPPGKATVAPISMHCKRFYAQMGASRKSPENRQKLVFRLLHLCNGCYSYTKWVLLFCINLTKSACIKMGATHIYECYQCIKGPLYGVTHRYTPIIHKKPHIHAKIGPKLHMR